MAMDDNEQQPAPITEASAPQVAERPLWVLSRDEQRVLIITFVGGLASIVVGAGIIGVAIALVRVVKPGSLLGFLILITVLDTFILVAGVNAGRLSGSRSKGALILWLFALVDFPILLLIWIGWAAGIH